MNHCPDHQETEGFIPRWPVVKQDCKAREGRRTYTGSGSELVGENKDRTNRGVRWMENIGGLRIEDADISRVFDMTSVHRWRVARLSSGLLATRTVPGVGLADYQSLHGPHYGSAVCGDSDG